MNNYPADNTRMFHDSSIVDLHTANRLSILFGVISEDGIAEYPICGDTIAAIRATA